MHMVATLQLRPPYLHLNSTNPITRSPYLYVNVVTLQLGSPYLYVNSKNIKKIDKHTAKHFQ